MAVRRFIDTGYFTCAFGLIFVYLWFVTSSFVVFHTFDICFISTEKRYLTYRFDDLYSAFQLQTQELDRLK